MDDAILQSLPDDPATLKRLVVELAQQRDVRISALERARQEWEQTRQQLELEKLRLAHQLELLRKRYYGPRADRVEPSQLLLEFAVALEKRPVDAALLPPDAPSPEPIDPQMIRRVRPRKGRRDLALFDKLPMTRQVHDLPPEAKPCPCCQTMRKPIGQESSWQVEYLPASFQRIEHVRLKYACPACEPNGENPQIVTAEKLPGAPIDKGMAGPGLLAYVITSKFSDFLPLYRLENIFARNGFEIDRSTMCVWAGDVADLVRPLHDRMVQRVLQSHVVHTDDTVMPMLAPEKTKQARMWVYTGDEAHPYNVFDFTLSRTRDGPAKFLRDFKGVLQADAYGGYDGICVEKSITQAGCWAHARRKFVDCQGLDPAITGEALTLIGRLFAIEAQGKGFSCADRLSLRQRESRPVLDTLRGKLLAWRDKLLPKHPVAQAIGYALNQWEPLCVFAADGAVAIDNNLAEREMKRQAI
ncbi:MAG: IS66 family transposase, partial [Planctomycetota bacterium]|nr:IS66 family transposase [Planctomycetota bacterium]